jgi:hypothetical protein
LLNPGRQRKSVVALQTTIARSTQALRRNRN